MFTLAELHALATWRVGAILGLGVRFLDIPKGGDDAVEIFYRFHPEKDCWRIWKGADGVTWMHRRSTDETVQTASVEDALTRIFALEWSSGEDEGSAGQTGADGGEASPGTDASNGF